MSDSILTSIKKNLGIDESYTAFDFDIILFINSSFSTLKQLGVGPEGGFRISDKTPTWDAFIGSDPGWNFVPEYVYSKVKLAFDPPTNSFAVEAIKEQIKELEWRINVYREETAWVDPNTEVNGDIDDEDFVLDGGVP